MPKHASVLTTLPAHHKDPSDRMLVAQALVESIHIVSIDAALDAYEVTAHGRESMADTA